MHRIVALSLSWTLLAVACAQEPEPQPTPGDAGAAAPGDGPTTVPSDFVRFVTDGDGGHLDTAITTYRKGDVELVLFGAVHIADQACYDTLNDRFTQCDVLLYELVGPEDYRPQKGADRGFNPIALLQNGLKNALELQFQLDAIDYRADNFVHADMTPAEFERSMAERGESLLSIMLEMMLSGMQMQREQAEAGEAPAPSAAPDLVTAFQNREGRHTLRMAFAQQLEQIEMMSAGGEGSTLLEGRNEKCLEVLQREVAAGRKKIGVYYGAAHLPHMEQRLVEDLGFTKTGHEWLVAWDCTKRLDKKYDRELVLQRRRCRDELAALAEAAKVFRRSGADLPTVAELAQHEVDGARAYEGPVQDPWGRDYVLRRRPTGSRWEALSVGQDGVVDTDDDLVAQEPRGR